MTQPEDETTTPKKERSFEEAGSDKPLSLVQEFYYFIIENKAWWLVPILVVLGLLALLVALAPTGAAPFIYSLF